MASLAGFFNQIHESSKRTLSALITESRNVVVLVVGETRINCCCRLDIYCRLIRWGIPQGSLKERNYSKFRHFPEHFFGKVMAFIGTLFWKGHGTFRNTFLERSWHLSEHFFGKVMPLSGTLFWEGHGIYRNTFLERSCHFPEHSFGKVMAFIGTLFWKGHATFRNTLLGRSWHLSEHFFGKVMALSGTLFWKGHGIYRNTLLERSLCVCQSRERRGNHSIQVWFHKFVTKCRSLFDFKALLEQNGFFFKFPNMVMQIGADICDSTLMMFAYA